MTAAKRKPGKKRPRALVGLAEVRAFLRVNPTPVFFVSPTPFNLLGLDRWVRNFWYVSYYDSFEGVHPRVFVPRERAAREFASLEDVNNWLLGNKEVADFVRLKGTGGKASFVMFDEESERLASELGLEVIHPSAALRRHLDSKLVTTRLGNRARVPSVPNVLGRAAGWDELRALADGAGLGDDLMVQTAYGDSGRTTFRVRGERDWDRNAKALVGEELKVMRYISNNRAVAIEAVITRHGTIVGPPMTDFTGYPELTPYHSGGWCGNDIYPDALTPKQQRRVRKLVRRFGAELAKEGYRGFFELDFNVDMDTGDVWLGELNPRVSGVSPMTNVTVAAYADMPLYAFHLLEHLGRDYEIDVEEINARWARFAADDVWSQVILKETAERVELFTATPRTGVWRLAEDGSVAYARTGFDWHSILDESEAFYLRVASPSDWRYRGADLGVLVTRGRMQTDDRELTPRCRQWLEGIKSQFASTPATPPEQRVSRPFAFKAYGA